MQVEINKAVDAELTGQIIEILEAQGAVDQPILLSKLGIRLAAALGKPLREVLGGRRLKEVLEESLGELAAFEGDRYSMAVRLTRPVPMGPTSIRFDPTFWAAFAKPIPQGDQRFLKVDAPFSFERTQLTERYIEVPSDLIPDPVLPKREREKAIIDAISAWCEEHSLRPTDFVEQLSASSKREQVRHSAEAGGGRSVSNTGIAALRQLIEAIPAEERNRYSLPMDLVHRLITG